jgi:pimeloyl-ACP methyl ester carboxylesterase
MSVARATGALSIGCLMVALSAAAQERPAFFDQPSTIRLVGHPASGARVPLLVAFPPTGDSAEWIVSAVESAIPLEAYVLVVTPGAPLRSDYAPAFSSYLDWTAARVRTDLETAFATQPVDRDRVYAFGFSLGGDLSWGLVARAPELFRGAVVMGSRSGARGHGDAMYREHHVRVAFLMGDVDDAVRRRGIASTEAWARSHGITTRMFPFHGQHEVPPLDLVRQAFTMVLDAPPSR